MSGERIDLGDATLAELAARGLEVPTYDRSSLVARIAHIGVGGFHRAHLALYCEHLARRGGTWGICGIGLLPGDRAMAEALAAQDHLYTFTEKGPGTRRTEVVGSIIDYVLATDDASLAEERIAHPDTAIVSMTVTESGYDDAERNRRTFDVIAGGLDRRRAASGAGITVMSCDNLPGNGEAAHRCVVAAAERRSAELAEWVELNCSFPNSMVDRITPVTAPADKDHLLDSFGLVDRWPVVGEPFWQWVLEDDFVAGRPDFESVGALYTDDVHAWELYKLRILNAGHSCIAYLSALAGITYVDEALAIPEIRSFLEHLLCDEAVPTLTEIPGHPREDYVSVVIDRFSNTGVRDQIARLCIDGTSKFPTFLMPTIAGQLARGGGVDRAALALAAWAHYLADVPEDAQSPDALGDVSRPLARAAAAGDPTVFVDERTGFPAAVAQSERFRAAFAAAHRSITEHGPIGALRSN
ncbi:MAG: mannitol dehydrogenase family protein [Ilumatobacteraceae bacterium]